MQNYTSAIIRQLEAGRLLPVYVLAGEETFLIDEILASLKKQLFSSGGEDFNSEIFCALETLPSRALEAAQTLPMFAEKRLVTVKELGQYSAERLKEFVPYLEDPCPSTCLVLISSKVAGNTVFGKVAAQKKFIIPCQHPPDRDLDNWIEHFATKRGKKMTREAVFCLKSAVGGDLQRLSHEVEKASLFVGERPEITLSDVEQLVIAVREHLIFELTDAIGRKDRGEAMRLVRSLVREGEPEILVFSMIVRQMRLMLMAASLLSLGKSRSDLASRLKVPPFVAQKLCEQVGKRSPEALAKLYPLLFEADQRLKSSSIPPILVLEWLVWSLAA